MLLVFCFGRCQEGIGEIRKLCMGLLSLDPVVNQFAY